MSPDCPLLIHVFNKSVKPYVPGGVHLAGVCGGLTKVSCMYIFTQ